MINEDLQKIHELDLMIAEELKRICQKHDISYFMIAGTLLGAIRHKGFIPWDDDMDFGMYRRDYNKFIKICETELDSSKFILQTEINEINYPFNFAKIRLKGTYIEEEFSGEIPLKEKGVFIDIFPFDNVSRSKLIKSFQYSFFWFFRNLLWIKLGYGNEKQKKNIRFVVGTVLSKLFSVNFLKTMKNKSILSASTEDFAKIEYVITGDGAYGLKKETLRKDWIFELQDYDFDGTSFPGIKDYDAYLTYFYGDYMKMPPIEKRNHHNRLSVDFGIYK